MNTATIVHILEILQNECKKWTVPIVTLIAQRSNDPYQILISTMLSLRTKDEVTTHASKRLFKKANNPYAMIKLSSTQIEKLIYPVGFYKTKTKNILRVSKILIDQYHGQVPDKLESLLEFPGVGRKTANLVITLGFNKPGICVDTHVHRISNRFGYVQTKTPEQTEMALRVKLPITWWIPYNDILVAFGQALCKPISPWCSRCPVEEYCQKIDVNKKR